MGVAFIAGAYKERPIAKSFSEATWEEIIYACKKNLVPENWNIGDQNTMLINGNTYIIDIIGKNHDEYADRNGVAPLTFQMHDCYETTYRMRGSNTNNGGWDSSSMYSSYLPEILALMPVEVQAGIKEVRKITSAGNTLTNLEASSNKLFLLSEIEVLGKITNSISGEGTQYAYYAYGGDTRKNNSGSYGAWWLRSPVGKYSSDFCLVVNNADKGVPGYTSASEYRGVSFAFCF